MQIYLRLPRRSIFGVSQSTIKPNTMQTLFAFYGAPYLRRSQRYAFNEKKTTVRRTNYQQSVDRSRLRIVWQYFWIYRRKSLSFVQPKSTELWITMKNWCNSGIRLDYPGRNGQIAVGKRRHLRHDPQRIHVGHLSRRNDAGPDRRPRGGRRMGGGPAPLDGRRRRR